jgi:hypothetical protein
MRMLPTLLGGLSCVAVAAEPLLSPPTDYGRSMIATLGPANAPLFWLESRCRVADPAAQVVRDYYQCGSCKSEDTFATADLFKSPNYDFLPVFTEKETIVFRRRETVTDGYRSVSAPLWGGMVPRIRPARARVLAGGPDIAAAVAAGLPLTGQVEIRDEETGRTAVLEFPIKTMNMGTDGTSWQVDTGPVVLPDLKAPPDQWSATLRLAFVAYNTADWADFIFEAPTALPGGGAEVPKVFHYSEISHRTTRNLVLAVDLDAPAP